MLSAYGHYSLRTNSVNTAYVNVALSVRSVLRVIVVAKQISYRKGASCGKEWRMFDRSNRMIQKTGLYIHEVLSCEF